ncbi:MAG: hypothetical protein FJ280_21770 [Planctomycetes bacterium]|nr:hypothetical protein [Planctomycetota bacterium]
MRASLRSIPCTILLLLAGPVLTKGEELGTFTDSITIPENKHLWIDGLRISGPEVPVRWDGSELWVGDRFRCRIGGRWDDCGAASDLVDEFGRVDRIRELMAGSMDVREALEHWYRELRELRFRTCDLSRSGGSEEALAVLHASPLVGRVLRFMWPEEKNIWLPTGFEIASLPSDARLGYYARGDSTKLIAYVTVSDPCDHGREKKPYMYPEYPTALDNAGEIVDQIRHAMEPSHLGLELVFMSSGSQETPPELNALTSMSISGRVGDPEIVRILRDIEHIEQGGNPDDLSGGRGVPWQQIRRAARSW